MNQNVRLIQKARSTGLLFPVIVVCGFLAGGLVIWQSWLLSSVISRVFLEKQTLMQAASLLRMILLVVTARVLFTVINESLSGRLAVKIKNGLREELINKIDRLGPIFLKGERAGELTTTTLQGLDALDAYFGQFLPQILLAFLLPVTILIVIFPIDLLTGVVFLVTAPLIPFFMIWIGKLSQNHTQRQWTALSRLGAYFLDTLQGLSTLMTLGRSKQRAVEIKDVSERYRTVTMNVLKITFLSAFVLEMIATISTALVAVEIGLRLLYGLMEFQQAFFILLIAPEFYLPLRNLSVRYHAGMNGLTAANRIFQLLDTPEQEGVTAATLRSPYSFPEQYVITFNHVAYRYPGREDFALEEINLTLRSGNHFALVGESGSGKSTLAYLLLRFITPTRGRILINGQDIQAWDIEAWRHEIAWMPQTTKIFNTSLMENIRLFDPAFSREDVMTALKGISNASQSAVFPADLDTPLLEGGARLSGGEARRVTLARAYLKNARLLLMDEPTAHLDLDLERNLITSTQKLRRGKTSLTIAHRLSTVIAADQIFVLQKGHLVESGNHQSLMAAEGAYTRLLTAARGKA